MIELSCPSCSAPFEVPDDAAPTVTCSYCGTSFERPARPRSARRDTITGLAIGALALVVGIIGAGVLVWYVLRTARSTAPDAPDQPAITAPGANDHPERQLATRTLLIGQKGEGPGRFDDNRTIAVDTAGRIYTAEYDDGWLQSFDATGTFAALWRLDDEKVVLDLLADRSGHLYVLYPQQVVVYDTSTGAIARTVPDTRATDLALTLDNRVLALEETGNVSEITAAGLEPPTVSGLAAKTGVKNVRFGRFAVDAHGDYLFVDAREPRVFRFSADGRFLDRFDATGLNSINDIALDGVGRILVSSVAGIGVFSADGRRLGSVDIRQAFGIVVADTGDLYVAARPTVAEFRMAAPTL